MQAETQLSSNSIFYADEPMAFDLENLPSLVPAATEEPGDSGTLNYTPGIGRTLPLDQDPGLEATDDGEIEAEEDAEITYDVPIVLNETVEDYIKYFNTRIRDKFELWLSRSGRYLPLMKDIFREYGLPEDLVFVALIESGFNPYAYSRAHAAGAWQFIRSTGRIYGLRIDDWVDERRDPIKATHSAARYLKDLYARFGSWPLALASYNAGENKIQKAIALTKSDDFWRIRKTRYIHSETKGYVPKFMAATIIAKNPERFGFQLSYYEPMAYDEAWVSGSASMQAIARAAGISNDDLKQLNPEVRTSITPPNQARYSVKLPAGSRDAFLAAYAEMDEKEKLVGQWHGVKTNETLGGLAAQFGVPVAILESLNGKNNRQIAVGETIFVPKTLAPKATRTAKKAVGKSEVSGNKIIYRVQKGDTLWDIANSFRISLNELRELNGIKSKRHIIRPGDRLILGFVSSF